MVRGRGRGPGRRGRGRGRGPGRRGQELTGTAVIASATGRAGDAVARPDAHDERRGPERRCIVTGAIAPKQGLIRFVVSPEGVVVPDVAGRLPGRGMWVTADRACLDKAVAKRLFARAARKSVTTPADLADNTVALLRRRCIELIGLARRGGLAVAGFEQVRAWLAEGRVAVLLAASDGAANGRAKLAGLAARRAPDAPIIDAFDSVELGEAFGRDRVIHAALASGGAAAGLADRLRAEVARLNGLQHTGATVQDLPATGSPVQV